MQLNEIKELLEAFSLSNITHFELSQGDFSLCLKKETEIVTVSQPVATQPLYEQPKIEKTESTSKNNNPINEVAQYTEITAPIVGVFYQSGSPGEPPFVSIGSHVKKGDTICLIESMKVINEVPSPVDGVIKEILVKNEDLLSFGDVIFKIEE